MTLDTDSNNENVDAPEEHSMGVLRRYKVTLKSLTPILMHYDNIEFGDALKKWQQHPNNKKLSIPGDDRSPAFAWLGCLYVSDQNLIVVPSENIMKCLLQGGAAVAVPGGKNGKTFKAQTQSGIMSLEENWVLTLKGKPISSEPFFKLKDELDFDKHKALAVKHGFSLHVKRARIGTRKHVRVRPKFNNWELTGHLDVYDDQITEEVLTQILFICGNYKGLGDWRPSSGTPGSWGRFSAGVERVEID